MKLLVLSSRPPWPPVRADQMTMDRLIRFLHARGETVDVACLVENAEAEDHVRGALTPWARRIEVICLPRWRSAVGAAVSLVHDIPLQVGYFASDAMNSRVAALVAENQYDLVYAHLIRTAEYARKLDVRKILGMQIAQSLNCARMAAHTANPAKRYFYRLEERRARAYEAGVARDFDRVVLVGERDLRELQRVGPVQNAVVCAHGQDVPPIGKVQGGKREKHTIVFSGVMSTNTNVDAVRWFAKKIFPRIVRLVPEAVLWIVGRNPSRAVRQLARARQILVTGEVTDVSDWLCRATVAVGPMRMGAGMQNKVLQSMACELPVVLTSVANEGIGALDAVHAIVRDEPEAFALAVVDLLRDESKRTRLGREARTWVETHWSWADRFEPLHALMYQVAASGCRISG